MDRNGNTINRHIDDFYCQTSDDKNENCHPKLNKDF